MKNKIENFIVEQGLEKLYALLWFALVVVVVVVFFSFLFKMDL